MFEIEIFKNNSLTIILTPFILTFILGVFYSSFIILDEKYSAMERKLRLLLKNMNEKIEKISEKISKKIENLEKQLRKENNIH